MSSVLPQDRMPVTGQPEKLLELKGSDLLGLPVKVRRCCIAATPFRASKVAWLSVS